MIGWSENHFFSFYIQNYFLFLHYFVKQNKYSHFKWAEREVSRERNLQSHNHVTLALFDARYTKIEYKSVGTIG